MEKHALQLIQASLKLDQSNHISCQDMLDLHMIIEQIMTTVLNIFGLKRS